MDGVNPHDQEAMRDEDVMEEECYLARLQKMVPIWRVARGIRQDNRRAVRCSDKEWCLRLRDARAEHGTHDTQRTLPPVAAAMRWYRIGPWESQWHSIR